MFHRPLLDVPDPYPSFCSTPPPTSQTPLSMTGIKRSPCATPHGGWQFDRLVEHNPLTGYEPKTCIEVRRVSTRRSTTSRGETASTRATTPATASEAPDMKEAGQSTSPLFSQEREVSSGSFCVSGFQQQAAASGSQQQASSSVINSWQSADLWSARKMVRDNDQDPTRNKMTIRFGAPGNWCGVGVQGAPGNWCGESLQEPPTKS